jgi:hypothetical protein
MTLSLAEISDRLEITDALIAYSTALDTPGRRWDKWYECFAPDASCEYPPQIGPTAPDKLQELFSLNDAVRLTTQHLFTNIVIDLDGDAATVRSECSYAALNRTDNPESHSLRLSGLWFDDDLERRDEGWRIVKRVGNTRWAFSVDVKPS